MSAPAPSATTSISARYSREFGVRVRRIGVDVGGTNTDAVLLQDGRVVHAVKTPTTEDVTRGIVTALELLGRHPEVEKGAIDGVVIGTTHFVNAVIQRRGLTRVAGIRIGLPASASLPPFCDWPSDLAELVRARVVMLEGGHDYDGREFMPFDETGMHQAARQIREDGIESVAIAAIFSPLDPSSLVVKSGAGGGASIITLGTVTDTSLIPSSPSCSRDSASAWACSSAATALSTSAYATRIEASIASRATCLASFSRT